LSFIEFQNRSRELICSVQQLLGQRSEADGDRGVSARGLGGKSGQQSTLVQPIRIEYGQSAATCRSCVLIC